MGFGAHPPDEKDQLPGRLGRVDRVHFHKHRVSGQIEAGQLGQVGGVDNRRFLEAAVVDLRDPAYPLAYANPAFERLTGYACAEARGLALGRLCADAADLGPVRAAERDRLLGFIEYAPLGMIALDWVSSGVAILDAKREGAPVIYVNAAFERLTGYAGEEAAGQPYGFFFADAENQAALDAMSLAMARRRELRVELRCRRKDGPWFWTELALSPVFDENARLTHYLGVQADISERREAARRLEDLSAELRRGRDNLVAILNEFPSGTLIVEADDTIAFSSDSCRSIIGITPAQAAGRLWWQVFPFDQPAAQALRQALSAPAAGRTPLELPWRDSTGQTRWAACAVKDDPRDPARRLLFLEDVSELRRLREALAAGRQRGLVGESEAMQTLNRLIGEIAKGDWTVLVEGETGVGKELVAHAIHAASPRRAGPYIAVNSAGLSESLLASQLFGHKKGAFTGATADQQGYFEAADGGTIFLDEIGDLPRAMSANCAPVSISPRFTAKARRSKPPTCLPKSAPALPRRPPSSPPRPASANASSPRCGKPRATACKPPSCSA